MAKRFTKKQAQVAQKLFGLLKPADNLLLLRLHDTAVRIGQEPRSLTGNPLDHIRLVLTEMPDWMLYRLIQQRDWPQDHQVLLYLLVNQALSEAEVLPPFKEATSSTIATMLMLVAVELLGARENKEMPENLALDLLKDGDGGMASDLIQFYSQSEPRLREPSEFELLSQLPQSKGLSRILAARKTYV